MASIRTDTGEDGMRNSFELAAAHLLQYDPVAKKRASGHKRGAMAISSVEGETADISAFGAKPVVASAVVVAGMKDGTRLPKFA